MTSLFDDRRLLLGLGSCLIGIIVLAGSIFVPLVDPRPQAGPGDVGTMASSGASPIRMAAAADMTVFTERPLFQADRRPFVAAKPQQAPTVTQVTPPGFRLAGIMGRADGTRWAYVTTEKGVVRVEVGETVEDWAVTGIEEDRVLIRRGADEFEIQSSGTQPVGSTAIENTEQRAAGNNSARTRLRQKRNN